MMVNSNGRTGIVMPCYNEAGRLQEGRLMDFLSENPAITICLVNDGSSDATLEALNRMKASAPAQVEVVDLPRNSGKGAAVREGVLYLAGMGGFDAIGFWDADLQIPADYIPMFVDKMREGDRLMVTACRVSRLGTDLQVSGLRHLISRSFAATVSFVLALPVYDTQCGAKLMHADMAAKLFDKPFVSRWIFDVEIFARLINIVGRAEVRKRVLEFPLERLYEAEGSRIKLMDWLKVPFSLLRVMSAYGLFSRKAD